MGAGCQIDSGGAASCEVGMGLHRACGPVRCSDEAGRAFRPPECRPHRGRDHLEAPACQFSVNVSTYRRGTELSAGDAWRVRSHRHAAAAAFSFTHLKTHGFGRAPHAREPQNVVARDSLNDSTHPATTRFSERGGVERRAGEARGSSPARAARRPAPTGRVRARRTSCRCSTSTTRSTARTGT